MKKTININLGGQPFIIDEPAFEILHRYFEALKLKFTNEGEQKEILSDIEGRVAEIFSDRLGKSRAVVAEEDVVHVISLMGRPEDIAGDTDTTPSAGSTAAPQQAEAPAGKGEKKLFRDPDNKKVAGVISGLCHYFGWGDPTWIRIVMVAAVVLSSFAHLGLAAPLAIIYLILLIVVPEATTSAEKLQMRGQPVTIRNIEKEVKDAMHTAASSVDSLMKSENFGGRFSQFLIRLVRVFGKGILVFILIVCLLLMFILVSGFLGLPMFDSLTLHEVLSLMLAGREMIILSYVALFLLIAIPLISVMYDVVRTLTNSDATNPVLRRVLGFGWALGFVIASFLVVVCVKSMEVSDTTKERIQLNSPKTGMLHIQLADTLGNKFTREDDDDFVSNIPINGIFKTANGFGFSGPKLEIAVSPDSNYYLEKVAFSRGSGQADVQRNIRSMHYRFSQSGDSVVNLDNKYMLEAGARWRSQRMKIRIYVPEGASLSFTENIDWLNISVKDNDYIDDHDLPGKILHVENGKIKCVNCKERMITDEEGIDGPEAPEAPESPSSHFDIHTGSDSDELKNFTVNIDDHGMEVRGKNKKNENVHVQINDKKMVISKTDSAGGKRK